MTFETKLTFIVLLAASVHSFGQGFQGGLRGSIKDAGGCLECVMWRSSAQWLRFELEPGSGVLVHGRVDLYPSRSKYQLVVDQVTELAHAKLRSTLDVSFANVNLSDAKLLLAGAHNDVQAAQAQLLTAMGIPGQKGVVVADEPIPTLENRALV